MIFLLLLLIFLYRYEGEKNKPFDGQIFATEESDRSSSYLSSSTLDGLCFKEGGGGESKILGFYPTEI